MCDIQSIVQDYLQYILKVWPIEYRTLLLFFITIQIFKMSHCDLYEIFLIEKTVNGIF